MKNKVVEINDDIVALEIIYKKESFLGYINKQDLEKVSSIRGTWHLGRSGSGHIDGIRTKVQKDGVRKQIWLHNFIMDKTNPDNVIDHIDHNTLNNTRDNLREVSKVQNAQNISTTLKSATHCRNVTIENGRYRVRINGISFGSYTTLEKAKEVAEKERQKIFPITSNLNNKIIL